MTNVNGLIKPKSFPETQHFYVSKSKDFTKNSWDNWNEWEEDLDKKLYQLPLPKAPNVTPGYSASTEWADWIAYKEEANIDLKKLDEVDLDLLLDALDNQRKHLFINHPLLLIDTAIPLIECAQCAEEIDLDTGDCGCWDLVCKACWNFMALCLTEGNCRNASAMEYSSLSTKGKEFVHEGGLTKYTGNDKKVVEKALSEGA
jgi:hypothetical protein